MLQKQLTSFHKNSFQFLKWFKYDGKRFKQNKLQSLRMKTVILRANVSKSTTVYFQFHFEIGT